MRRQTNKALAATFFFHLGCTEALIPVPYATQESRLVRYTSYCSRGTICASTGLNGAPQVRTKKERTNRSLPRQSRLETASTWALRTSNPLAVSRETATLALTMARSEDAAGESPEEGIGREDDAKAPRTTSTAAWISLAMLLLVYISNQWSRSLVYYVQNFDVPATAENAKEFMNVALGFDETQYGLLASFSFTLLFSTFSLIAGRAVDVISRKAATIGPCLVWSAMAAGTAFATGFPEVFALRVVQGSAQAFTTPAAYTLISDIFPPSSRATANAVYSSGVYLGGALASFSLLMNGAIGWRQSHLVVASVGVVIALVSFALLQDPGKQRAGGVDEASSALQGSGATKAGAEPSEEGAASVAVVTVMVSDSEDAAKDERADDEVDEGVDDERAALLMDGRGGGASKRESFQEALTVVFQSKTIKLLFAATAFRFCAGFGIGVWCAPFFRGRFPSSTSEFSVLNALVVAGGGLLSSFTGGLIADKYAPKDPRVRAWIPMIGSLLAVPCWMGVVSGGDFYTSLAFLLAEYVVAECWFGPTVTILQEGLPASVKGVGQGVFSTLSAFGTLAPPLMGALIKQGGFELQDVLFWTVSGFYVVSAAFFYLAGESVLDDTTSGTGRLKQA